MRVGTRRYLLRLPTTPLPRVCNNGVYDLFAREGTCAVEEAVVVCVSRVMAVEPGNWRVVPCFVGTPGRQRGRLPPSTEGIMKRFTFDDTRQMCTARITRMMLWG